MDIKMLFASFFARRVHIIYKLALALGQIPLRNMREKRIRRRKQEELLLPVGDLSRSRVLR